MRQAVSNVDRDRLVDCYERDEDYVRLAHQHQQHQRRGTLPKSSRIDTSSPLGWRASEFTKISSSWTNSATIFGLQRLRGRSARGSRAACIACGQCGQNFTLCLAVFPSYGLIHHIRISLGSCHSFSSTKQGCVWYTTSKLPELTPSLTGSSVTLQLDDREAAAPNRHSLHQHRLSILCNIIETELPVIKQ